MAKTGFVTHSACVQHDPGPNHPERPERLRRVQERLAEAGLLADLEVLEARPATRAELERVHEPALVDAVASACELAPMALDGDTAVSSESFDAALRAAGGLLLACERVLGGEWRNAFCGVRPPGHHAERDRSMGFCLFNNVAVAAAALTREHGLERVAILDWDVHHGNGTQHVFEERPEVFYASLHQWPLYPGTGAADERGEGEGEGATLNCPMPAGADDGLWLRALEASVLPALEAYRPGLILISAGFDAHRLDPLAGTCLTEEGYRAMTRSVTALAGEVCGGRVVSVLEGGYHLDALASCVETHVAELAQAAPCA